MSRNRIALIFLAALFVAACGNKNNFQATDAPELQIEGEGYQRLQMPPNESRTQSQSPIELRNTGDVPLEVISLTWIDKPERLVYLGERGDSCTTTADCGDDAICLTASGMCVSTAMPTTFEIGPQLRADLDFAITPGPLEMTCPTPSVDVPEEIAASYCGGIEIRTNATNNFGSAVVEGNARIYFLNPGASGAASVSPTFLEFANVQPGTTHTQTFSVTNEGQSTLEILSVGVEDNQNYFTITPFPVPSVSAGQAQTFDVTLAIPAGATDYDFITVLRVQTTGGDAFVSIDVTAEAGGAPVIELSDEVLRFDGQATQTFTVTNTGQATLVLNGLTVTPQPVRDFYTVTVDGSNNIAAGTSRDVTVVFDRMGETEASTVGLLEIAHNARNQGNASSITLLGDEGDSPIGQLRPESFTFLAAAGNSETRTFAVRNVGTAPLEITGVEWAGFAAPGSSADEFAISPTTGTVAPGGLFTATVTFTGANTTADNGLAVLTSNNSAPLELLLRALESTNELPVPQVNVVNQGSLVVNSPISLSAAATTPAGITTNGIWTLVGRPAASEAWLASVGETASFTPDVSGAYKVAFTVLNGGSREAQTITDITVE